MNSYQVILDSPLATNDIGVAACSENSCNTSQNHCQDHRITATDYKARLLLAKSTTSGPIYI